MVVNAGAAVHNLRPSWLHLKCNRRNNAVLTIGAVTDMALQEGKRTPTMETSRVSHGVATGTVSKVGPWKRAAKGGKGGKRHGVATGIGGTSLQQHIRRHQLDRFHNIVSRSCVCDMRWLRGVVEVCKPGAKLPRTTGRVPPQHLNTDNN